MELTGKVIIFKSEDDAKMWFKSIQGVENMQMCKSLEKDYQKFKERMANDIDEMSPEEINNMNNPY